MKLTNSKSRLYCFPPDFPLNINLFDVNSIEGSITSANDIVKYIESARCAHLTGAILLVNPLILRKIFKLVNEIKYKARYRFQILKELKLGLVYTINTKIQYKNI